MVKKMKKLPAAKSRNGTSTKGVIKLIRTSGALRGGILADMVKFATMRRARTMKADIRIAQGKSTRSIRGGSMAGKKKPPRELPATTIPIASARRRRNQDVVVVTAG